MRRRDFLKSGAVAGASIILTPVVTVDAQNLPGQKAPPVYPLGPDSLPKPGVPKGTIFELKINNSKTYSGSDRTVHVYIPAQYKAEKPACLWICFDQLSPSTHTVLDNLIHSEDIPIMIGVGLSSGTTPSIKGKENIRYNRDFEFDSITSTMGRFLLEDLIPELQRNVTPDNLPIKISIDPNDRGLNGGSSGGIAAFNGAWCFPDDFRRVYSRVGTFVGMRGGDTFPVLVRKTEPKPLRVFLQDGDKDGWPGGLEFGDWWMGNQEMERSLTFAGYEVNHEWGVLGHEGTHGEHILPNVMRWLWKDWPKPVQPGESKNSVLHAILDPAEKWETIGPSRNVTAPAATNSVGSLACDANGNVYVQNPSSGEISRIDSTGKMVPFVTLSSGNNGIAFGPDGRLFVSETAARRIVACDANGKVEVVSEGLTACQLTVTADRRIYVTEASNAARGAPAAGRVWMIQPDGTRTAVAEGIADPSAISLSPDGLWLFVADTSRHHGYSYQVRRDGTLAYGEPFYWFHTPDRASDSGCNQACADRDGLLYTATRMGVQVFDRNGRVRAILPVANSELAGVCFGDRNSQTLYVSSGTAVYRRRLKVVGAQPWEAIIVEPQGSAG